jgi:pimeloyl-ACP methyl ester carboxylesterase
MTTISVAAPHGLVAGFDIGEGPPVVLLAGLGSTARIWGNLPAVMARRFRVIAVDNRGVGGSTDGRGFTLRAAAEDLAAVLDALEIDRAAVLGASMGGVIALTAALATPERISRLVIVSSAARLTIHGRRLLEVLQDLLLYAPPDRAGAALMTLAFSPAFHERFAGFVDDAERLYGPNEADVPGTLLQLEHLLRGWDLRDELPSLDLPALVLCGDRDPVVAPEDTVELAELLPHAELVEVPGAAHSVLAEGGEATLDRVLGFLAGNGSGGGPSTGRPGQPE